MRFLFLAAILIGLPLIVVAKDNHASDRRMVSQKATHPRVPFYSDLNSRAGHPHMADRSHIKMGRVRSTSYSSRTIRRSHKNSHKMARPVVKRIKAPKHVLPKGAAGRVETASYRYAYPEGAKAQCFDGSYSRSGSCAAHGGVFWQISRK